MRYLTNDRNIVKDALLTVSNIVASNVVYRTDEDAKAGGGQVALTGDYSGADDTTIDIKIVDEIVSGTPKVSAPVFSGVGNGVMTGLAATSAIAAQTITAVLEDLGTATVKAYAPFAGITLRALASGTAGNLIKIAVDNSALTFAPTAFSLQHDLAATTNEYTGDEWDFGAAVLNPDLTIPDSAPRLSFGADPQVYRQYKHYRDGQYVFGFSPAPVRDASRGTVVNAVGGSRTVTISNGTTTETVSNAITVYDALNGIRAGSTLVEVIGAIVNDKTSGGQGATDLSVWTSAYVVSIGNSGGDQVAHADLIVTPDASAPTETVTLTVIDSTQVGAELWSVRGDVSGRLANAITNVLYGDSHYAFTIPAPVIDTKQPKGTITVLYVETGTTGRDGGDPTLCAQPAIIGAAGRSGTWEFIYKKKPLGSCDCTTGALTGGPDDTCLGITPDGGTTVSDESRLIRLQRLAADVRGFVGDNTPPYPTVGTADAVDIDWINRTGSILKKCLSDISGYTPLPVWQASHAYDVDQMRESVNRNGYRFAVTAVSSDKLSGGSEPAWVNTIGSTTTDNHVTWTCIGKTPLLMWDDVRTQWRSETQALASVLYGRTAATMWSAAGTIGGGSVVRPTTANRNGQLYFNPGVTITSGGSEPTWPTTARSAVADGTGKLVQFLSYWSASTAYKAGAEVTPGDGYTWEALADGTSGGSDPNWFTAGATLTDNTITWVRKGSAALTVMPADEYFDRYNSLCNEVLAAAGIDPNFKRAGTGGDGCWQDFGDSDFWWEFNGTEPYLPAQTGHYYHSAKLVFDPATGKQVAQSTKEFGFALRFGCVNNLVEGDIIQVIIAGDAGTHGYQDGDQFNVRVNHAIPIPLGGGQTGNDTLKFHIAGTVAGSFATYNLLLAGAPPARVNSHVYAQGDRYVPAVANGRFYECLTGGAAAGSPPVFTTNRTSFTDGSATFIDMGGVSSYSESGLSFDITPGGIDFALGDKFTFVVEGGHFQWRRDGGSWSSNIVIADSVDLHVALDGLSATFTGGTAPSWKTGDQWSFKAEATNGPKGLRQPTDARMAWTGSTSILVDPGTTKPADSIMIADHTIPSDATITLQGSDDSFATAPLNQVIPWRATHIYAALTNATHAEYRLLIDRSGDANWLWLGMGLDMLLPNNITELGKVTKRIRMPSLNARRANFAQVEHTMIKQASADALADGLAHACEFDDQRLGVVISPSEVGIAAFNGDLEFTDLFEFQPDDPTKRRLSVTLQLAAVA